MWGNKQDKHGAYLIDRSPEYFEPILNYLRHGQLIVNEGINIRGKISEEALDFLQNRSVMSLDDNNRRPCFPGVLEEARFFGIEQLAEQLDVAIKVSKL